MSGPASAAPRAGPAFPAILRAPLSSGINHLLRSAAWALERLRPHAGRTVHFTVAPLSVALTILPSGEVADADRSAPHDLRVALTAGVALRVIAGDEHAWQEARSDGDVTLARDVLYVVQNLRWDAGEDLSRVFGDIVAQRIVTTGNDIHRSLRAAAGHFARSTAAYWTDEQPLIAARPQVDRFNLDVDALRDDVARIEKRVERLTAVDAEA
jgi:ubiquinone biosynthesis protein UbiJ